MSSAPHPRLPDDLLPDGPEGTTSFSTRPSHELVVDLSLLEFALWARQGRNAWGSLAQADADFQALLLPKQAILGVFRILASDEVNLVVSRRDHRGLMHVTAT